MNKIDILSPVDGSLIGSVPSMEKVDIDREVEVLKKGFKLWKDISLEERGEILIKGANLLEKRAEEIGKILAMEVSKDYKSCISEVKRTADFIRYTVEEGKRLSGENLNGGSFSRGSKEKVAMVSRVPLGIILGIAPFNYPVNLSASKIAPALIGGNVVLFKPPSQGAVSALKLVDTLIEAGLPKDVLRPVTGRGSVIGDYLITHPDVNMINFTGSSEIGKHIAKSAGMIPLLMELGGKDAAIVLSDGDLDKAAKDIVSGGFSYSGQRCTAIKRVLVEEEVADNLVEKIVKLVEKLKVGLPFDEGVVITPLIDEKGANFVDCLVDDALKKEATLLTKRKREKNLIYPVVLDHVTKDMDIAWKEPFGPVLPIIRIKDWKEGVEVANESEYGLQSSVFTKDMDKAFKIATTLEVGTVHINNKTQRGPDHFPFSGIKSSGIGTQGIKYSIEAMTRVKSIVFDIG